MGKRGRKLEPALPNGQFMSRQAYFAVHSALKRGLLKRQSCEVCQNEKSAAHHDDYSKPLDVRWLCQKHHSEHHKLHGFASRRTKRPKLSISDLLNHNDNVQKYQND